MRTLPNRHSTRRSEAPTIGFLHLAKYEEEAQRLARQRDRHGESRMDVNAAAT
jgi:hypothetical protein